MQGNRMEAKTHACSVDVAGTKCWSVAASRQVPQGTDCNIYQQNDTLISFYNSIL